MRIAMVSEHASPLAVVGGVDAGGQNVHVAALSSALVARGHDVTVYTRRTEPDQPDRVETPEGTVIEHMSAGPAREVPKDEMLPLVRPMARHLAAAWQRDTPDVVHGHFWMSGLAALVAARETRVPVVETFHALGVVKRRHQGSHDTSPPERIRLERAIARDASRVLATCSDEVFELARMGVRRHQVSVVPCGVDVTHFSSTGPVAAREPGRHRLLTVGRLVPRKGVEDAVRALALVPTAELVVAGGPPLAQIASDPEVRRLRAVAQECGVGDRVRFLGAVPRADMPALLRSADLCLAVPWYEPFGMVALEAMACGVAVVATAVGGLQDTVVDGATGTLVPPRRPDVLAHALRRLLADPVRREGFGLAGLDRAVARYSWQRIALDTEHVYEQVTDAALLGAQVVP